MIGVLLGIAAVSAYGLYEFCPLLEWATVGIAICTMAYGLKIIESLGYQRWCMLYVLLSRSNSRL